MISECVIQNPHAARFHMIQSGDRPCAWPQTRLGPYEILAALGAGGMGEVYRARDTKLGREVALKVLPEAFASDPQRMARFERAARVLASLNHPNIASIHGLEESGSTRALVMELVEGPTLAERARSGPLPVDEALRTACQIAEALVAAHEKGIIHRDLKPANVKVTPAGAVKVLDFGLAKAMEDPVASDNAPDSPTLTAAATQADTIMGTPAYMAPEQARGQAVDKRADIWAFGAVLFEMLTGQHAFAGETTSDVLDSGAEVRPRLERGARLDAAVRRQAAAPLPHQRSQATPAGIPPPLERRFGLLAWTWAPWLYRRTTRR